MTATSTTELQRVTARPPFGFEMAGEADDVALRRLLRETPMDGRIRLTLEREPSFFAAACIEGDPHHVAVARETTTGEIVGMGSRSVRDAFVNGQPLRLGYLSQLRVHPNHRGRARHLLRGGFELLRATRAPDEAPFDITTIIADNHAARRVLEARLTGMPIYQRVESFVTLSISVKGVWSSAFRRNPSPAPPEGGTPNSRSRRAEILACLDRNSRRFQFAPHWTTENLCPRGLQMESFHVAVKNGRTVGCLAVWDQRAFKHTVVRGYDSSLRRWRWLLNLPPVGSVLRMAFASHLAVDDDDPEVFASLLASAVNEARASGLQWLAVGLAARHPLVEVVRRRFRPREYESVLYLVHDSDADIALDDRIPHLEVALL